MKQAVVTVLRPGLAVLLVLCPMSLEADGEEQEWLGLSLPEIDGFFELRTGWRTQDDPRQEDISVAEARLRVELSSVNEWVELRCAGDLWADGVTERVEHEGREAWIFGRPLDNVDLKIGRQILTWGTGDLVFVNDLFPKDWQSYFIGRDTEYLKAPSDAIKLSVFTTAFDIDVVYSPRFDPDRYITGEYISYWGQPEGSPPGQNRLEVADTPDRWFHDDELAVRVYRNIRSYELALYGYRGFWKRPRGQDSSGAAIFPRLEVIGASARGQLGPGIANVELAWYRSLDDRDGDDPRIDNSEMRYLVGYAVSLGRDLDLSIQYYVEQLMDHTAYLAGLQGGPPRDRLRDVVTLQLTKLLMNQNLELSLSGYHSPSDQDAFLRPRARFKLTDQISLEAGASVFLGRRSHTFFGQLESNTNIFTAVRYSP